MALKRVASQPGVEVSLFLSKAAEEVTRMYGLRDRLYAQASVPRSQHLYLDRDHQYSYPVCGKFNLAIYDALVVSPASANTVAKIAYGIADSLVAAITAMACKGPPRVYLVPTDLETGRVTTRLPMTVDPKRCEECGLAGEAPCPVLSICPYGAIHARAGVPTIDLCACHGCMQCARACPGGAFRFGREIEITIRQLDAENAQKLWTMPEIQVCSSPREVLDALARDFALDFDQGSSEAN